MKKLVICLIVLILLYVLWNALWSNFQKPSTVINPVTPTPIISASPTPKLSRVIEISQGNNFFQAAWITVSTSSAVQLYPNFKEKLSALEVKKNNSCIQLTSAGFYDKNSNPLGLFVSNGISVKGDRPNEFFNGYFYLNSYNKFVVSDTAPDLSSKIALQSGPILLLNGEPRNLKIIDDKPARRIIVGTTKDEELIFIALFNKDNNLDGPLLTQVPMLLSRFVQTANINLQSALNLDGGSASAFYTDGVSLSELTSVGGFFCIK